MSYEECGDYIGGLSVTSTADDAMQNARDVASLPTHSLFGSSSTATTYWTPWTASIFGIKLSSGAQIADTRKKDFLTSVSLNLQNLESCSAVHYQRMNLMKRVRIGGSFFERTPTI